MIPTLVLSETNAQQALKQLDELIKDPWTVLAVFGKTTHSQTALNLCSQRINSGHPYYAGVRCVHIPNPSIVINYFAGLNVNPDLSIDWSQAENYLIFSVSAIYNNIGWIYTAEGFAQAPQVNINRLILKAQATDLSL